MIFHRINCPTFGSPSKLMFCFIDRHEVVLRCKYDLRRRDWEKERAKGIKPLKGTEQRANFKPVNDLP